MKKTGLLILIVMLLGVASARSPLSFAFDDQGFTYFGSKQAYLSLSLEGEKLVVHLSDEPTDMKLGFDKIASAKYRADDGSQKSYREADYRKDPQARLTLAKLAKCNVSYSRAEIAHKNAHLRSVVGVYQQALEALGFEPESTVIHGNIRDYVFAHGEQRLKVSFSRSYDEGTRYVEVRMTTL